MFRGVDYSLGEMTSLFGEGSENLSTMSPPKVPRILLVLALSYPHARRLREGVLAAVERHGEWQLIDCDAQVIQSSPQLLEGADGVITSVGQNGTWLRELVQRGVHVVNCNEYWIGTHGIATVSTDWTSLAALAVEHFHQLGMGCVAYAGAEIARHERFAKRMKAMQALGRKHSLLWRQCELEEQERPRDIDVPVTSGLDDKLAAFLRDVEKPCGVLCEDDALAAKLCLVAQQLGLHIPRDVAVIGQGNRLIGQTARPPLTTIVPPGAATGYKAAEVLYQKLHGRSYDNISWVPCSEFIVRGSTARVAEDAGIERAWRQLEAKAVEGITIQELALLAGCSVKTFRRRIRLHYGVDPALEIRKRRFEEAKRLLIETDLCVSEIGARCGFPAASNFFNFFRRHASCGPADFRMGEGRDV